MHIKGPIEYPFGFTSLSAIGDANKALMDFGILRMRKGETYHDAQKLERACLLIGGEADFLWEGTCAHAKRGNCFDDAPWVLHVPAGVSITIIACADSELSFHAVENANVFPSKLYRPEECADEMRGAGTMRETSTRIVRTVFDKTNAPLSNLVLGEVITFPGKWSSYPPHHHPQPEIYFYKFLPANGYGICQLGDNAAVVHENSTVFIVEDETHPQTAAPGYAMWYLWVICHLDGKPYIQPVFIPEHEWVKDPDAVIWPDKKGRQTK